MFKCSYWKSNFRSSALQKNAQVVDRIIKKVNYNFEFIDLGGGMGISYENNTKKLNYNKYNDEIKRVFKK